MNEKSLEEIKKEKLALRLLLNVFFGDVDSGCEIETSLANAIVDTHLKKIWEWHKSTMQQACEDYARKFAKYLAEHGEYDENNYLYWLEQFNSSQKEIKHLTS